MDGGGFDRARDLARDRTGGLFDPISDALRRRDRDRDRLGGEANAGVAVRCDRDGERVVAGRKLIEEVGELATAFFAMVPMMSSASYPSNSRMGMLKPRIIFLMMGIPERISSGVSCRPAL